MLSDDLRDMRAALQRNAQRFDGQVFLDARQAAAVLKFFDHVLDVAQAQEQLIYATARPLPEGVADIEGARRRREVRAEAQGGAA